MSEFTLKAELKDELWLEGHDDDFKAYVLEGVELDESFDHEFGTEAMFKDPDDYFNEHWKDHIVDFVQKELPGHYLSQIIEHCTDNGHTDWYDVEIIYAYKSDEETTELLEAN